MDSSAQVKTLLHDLATLLDSPEGPGGGAVCLAAMVEIEMLEQHIAPAEPCIT